MRLAGKWWGVLLVALLAAAVLVPVGMAQQAAVSDSTSTPVTPERVRALFDGYAVLVMFVWGLLCKYVPALAKVPNLTIPWVNLLGYVLTQLGAGALGIGVAHAGSGVLASIPDAVGVLVGGFTNAAWAMLLYEGWGRGLLERLLRLKKAAA